MPGRTYTSGNGYRYGFNGKEKDDEVKGQGAQYDYGFRIYDPRLGRFLSVDPLMQSYPWYTPYQFAGNMPIWAIDLDGLEEMKANSVAHIIKDINGNIINSPTSIDYQGKFVTGIKRIDGSDIEVTPGLYSITPGRYEDYNTFTWQQVEGKKFMCLQSYTPIGKEAGGTPPKTNLVHTNDDVPVTGKPQTTTVITPINSRQVQSQTLTRSINFVAGQPQFAADADRQTVDQIAANAPNSTKTSRRTTTNGNTTTNTTTRRATSSIITIDLRTDLSQSPTATNLLNNRYSLIKQQLVDAGVPAANIRRGSTAYDSPEAHATNSGNQTIFKINTTSVANI